MEIKAEGRQEGIKKTLVDEGDREGIDERMNGDTLHDGVGLDQQGVYENCPDVSLNPLDFCVQIRNWVWKGREPLARFIRLHYIDGKALPHNTHQVQSPDKVLFPSPPAYESSGGMPKTWRHEVELAWWAD